MGDASHIRDWMFRAILFESDAQSFRDSGIRIGVSEASAESYLLETTLAPFPIESRKRAMRMTRLYAEFFCFENALRDLISERLAEALGPDWWETKVSPKIRGYAERVREESEKNSWLEGERSRPWDFLLFGHLADLVINHWDHFADLVPSQHWLKQRLDELEQVRNFLAHNRMLSEAEFNRVEMYIADWNRQVGF